MYSTHVQSKVYMTKTLRFVCSH